MNEYEHTMNLALILAIVLVVALAAFVVIQHNKIKLIASQSEKSQVI